MDAARIAAIVTWAAAAGFGLPTVPVALYLLRHDELPWVFGGAFRAYGGGLFDRFSPAAFTALLGAFLVLNVVEAYCGLLLWQHNLAGGVLALAVLPVEVVFWLGFALPIPPILMAARLVLLVLAWKGLQ